MFNALKRCILDARVNSIVYTVPALVEYCVDKVILVVDKLLLSFHKISTIMGSTVSYEFKLSPIYATDNVQTVYIYNYGLR